jgi:DNA invertase Pin-like site-specific DNA recombinase
MLAPAPAEGIIGPNLNNSVALSDILLAVMSALAKQEAIRLSDRTKAGMARAKAAGKHVGRPSLNIGDHIAKLIAGGASVYRAAKECGIDHKTAAKYAALSRDALSRE